MTVVSALRRLADRLLGIRPEDRCSVTGRVHDYPDSNWGEPWHFAELECRYCGGRFTI